MMLNEFNLETGSCDVLQVEVVGLATLFVELLQAKISRVLDSGVIHFIGCGTVRTLVQNGSSRNCA